jgi:hypothetical protein
MTSRNPLRVLLILPMLLASLYIAVPAIPIAVHAATGASISVDPASFASHSIGKSLIGPSSNTYTITVNLQNVAGPADMQAWNIAGKVDPNFFRVQGLPLFSISPLKPVCNANFGADFYTTYIDPLTGRFAASEYCGGLADGQGYIGSGGALLTVTLKVVGVGVSSICLDTSQSFLVTIAGGVNSNIPVAVGGCATFNNSPAFSADVAGGNIQGPKSVAAGTSVGYHVPLTSTGPVIAQAELTILRPNGKTTHVFSGPVTLSGTGDAFFSYTPTLAGFYQVTASVVWSEDGGAHYLYAGATSLTRSNLDLTAF